MRGSLVAVSLETSAHFHFALDINRTSNLPTGPQGDRIMPRRRKRSSQTQAAIVAALQIAQEHAAIIAANTPATTKTVVSK
jgi:hypothetical protein